MPHQCTGVAWMLEQERGTYAGGILAYYISRLFLVEVLIFFLLGTIWVSERLFRFVDRIPHVRGMLMPYIDDRVYGEKYAQRR